MYRAKIWLFDDDDDSDESKVLMMMMKFDDRKKSWKSEKRLRPKTAFTD